MPTSSLFYCVARWYNFESKNIRWLNITGAKVTIIIFAWFIREKLALMTTMYQKLRADKVGIAIKAVWHNFVNKTSTPTGAIIFELLAMMKINFTHKMVALI